MIYYRENTKRNKFIKSSNRLAVVITGNDRYVGKSIIALKAFAKKNEGYDRYIIGTTFTDQSHELCKEHDVNLLSINLEKDFYDLDKRPYGHQFPIECYYHFYAYKMLNDYDYVVNIEADVYTNKKLDIDFDLVEFIGGGSVAHASIAEFSPIMNDLQKICKTPIVTGDGRQPDTQQNRILGGFRIFNVKNLHKINFYEEIVKYYKYSWEASAPRCGDDSLMVLYQLFNKERFYLLGPEYNIQIGLSVHLAGKMTEATKKTFHFHFGEPYTGKCWDTKRPSHAWYKNGAEIPETDIEKYFKNKYIEFVYNNFSLEFIKEHLPAIYVDIDKTKINFYYYNKERNFGDLLTPYFLNKFCEKEDYEYSFENNSKPKIISCGSIMRLCDNRTVVYGSGIRDVDQDISGGVIKIVRGPLTRDRLQKIGCYCPPDYGDPGLLLPLYYNPKIEKKYKLGIIPHYIHFNKINKIYENEESTTVIDLTNEDVEEVIDQILSCEFTISSSLHGLIASDAYGIPNKWVQFDDRINGDNTKYRDYFQSVKRKNVSFIDCFGYKKLPVDSIIEQIEPVNIQCDIDELQDNMFFDKNGIKNYTKYLIKNLDL